MSLKIYNVMNKRKEDFIPIDGKNVKMYACGITCSADAHIGHAYQAIVFDVIKRYLDYKGYNVTYVRNYTDVDDKIIARANALNVCPTQYANELMDKIDSEMDALGIERPTIFARATQCIPDIIEFVQKIIDAGFGYVADNGDVFFEVDKYKEYGKFSNRINAETLSGVRKEIEASKAHERDFALWKSAKEGEIFWDSPWGKGRPGWHIECSTMVHKYLGESIDIHGGGKDLIFPHHENEIAQSECLTHKTFAKYWIHNGLIKINGEKMSKSLGNSILLADLLNEFDRDTIRITLLQNHYKSDMNIMDGIFNTFERKIYDYYVLFDKLSKIDAEPNENSEEFETIVAEFNEAMDNDFNTAIAVANLLQYYAKMLNFYEKKEYQNAVDMKNAIIKVYGVLGLLQRDPRDVIEEIQEKYLKKANLTADKIGELINQRIEFKANKQYAEADKIRNDLTELGIQLKDDKNGTTWDIIIK
ncbi:MAG: cysteine--tRNA ligase [Clostridia bacterium]|nr:cysteine--tRNA ligase [Clostridia bacterium]